MSLQRSDLFILEALSCQLLQASLNLIINTTTVVATCFLTLYGIKFTDIDFVMVKRIIKLPALYSYGEMI